MVLAQENKNPVEIPLPGAEDYAAPLDDTFRYAAETVFLMGDTDLLPTSDDVIAVGYYIQSAFHRLKFEDFAPNGRYEGLLDALASNLETTDFVDQLKDRFKEYSNANAPEPSAETQTTREMVAAKVGLGRVMERRHAKQVRATEINELKEKAKTNGNKINISDLKPDDELVLHMLHRHSHYNVASIIRGTVSEVIEAEDGTPAVRVKIEEEKWKGTKSYSTEHGRESLVTFPPRTRSKGSTTVFAGSAPLDSDTWSDVNPGRLSFVSSWAPKKVPTIAQGELLRTVEGQDLRPYGLIRSTSGWNIPVELDQLSINDIDIFAPRVWAYPDHKDAIDSNDRIRHALPPSYH